MMGVIPDVIKGLIDLSPGKSPCQRHIDTGMRERERLEEKELKVYGPGIKLCSPKAWRKKIIMVATHLSHI